VYGRRAGTQPAYAAFYSEANKTSGITWSEKHMYEYLLNPKRYVVGTRMQFPGIRSATERADICAFLGECKESGFTHEEEVAVKRIRFGWGYIEQTPSKKEHMESLQEGGLLDAFSFSQACTDLLFSMDFNALSEAIDDFVNPKPPAPLPNDHAEAGHVR
jgi:hypothetical protein